MGDETTGSRPPWPPEAAPHEPPRPTEPPRSASAPVPPWDRPERTFDDELADRLLEQRVVIAGGRLDDIASNRVAAQLLLLGDSDRPIELHLSCPDSELGPALALAEVCETIQAPVHAVVRGRLRGPAVAVLCAGASRAAHRNAMIVLSLTSTGPVHGTASELATFAEQHERQLAGVRERIRTVTGRPEEEVAADLRSGRVLSAEEAREYGLLTGLL